jgi:hypothetical protein
MFKRGDPRVERENRGGQRDRDRFSHHPVTLP